MKYVCMYVCIRFWFQVKPKFEQD
jgi:hypothetical protein